VAVRKGTPAARLDSSTERNDALRRDLPIPLASFEEYMAVLGFEDLRKIGDRYTD